MMVTMGPIGTADADKTPPQMTQAFNPTCSLDFSQPTPPKPSITHNEPTLPPSSSDGSSNLCLVSALVSRARSTHSDTKAGTLVSCDVSPPCAVRISAELVTVSIQGKNGCNFAKPCPNVSPPGCARNASAPPRSLVSTQVTCKNNTWVRGFAKRPHLAM